MVEINITKILKKNKDSFGRIFAFNYKSGHVFDFTKNNKSLKSEIINNPKKFNELLWKEIQKNNASFGIGKYNEKRVIYQNNNLFEKDKDIHKGIDLFVPAKSIIITPLKGVVYSITKNDVDDDDNNNNNNTKNKYEYGSTIILKHELDCITFFTLYGNLSNYSLDLFKKENLIEKGAVIGTICTKNKILPPHLHFQIITNMQGRGGNFPRLSKEEDEINKLCINPNLILQLEGLEKD